MPDNKILVIRGGAVGDFILTLPVLAALRRQFPATTLEVLAYPPLAELARTAGLVDGSRAIDGRPLASFFARAGELSPDWSDYFSRFAVIISFLYDPDGFFRTNLGRCSRAQFIAGPHRPDDARSIHATEVLLQALERLTIFDADPIPRLPWPTPNPRAPALAVHPGSGSESKNWPEVRWGELLQKLSALIPGKLLLVGGEAEGDRLDRLAQFWPADRLEIARQLPLTALAARLVGATAFIGHDSGITHLAAALGVPVLSLWGVSNDAVWRPRGDRVQILKAPGGLGQLTIAEVLAAVARLRA
jgi:heptosyltransferase-2